MPVLFYKGLNLRFAGSDTVAIICTAATFYVLNDDAICRRLVEELDEAWPDEDATVKYEALEKLPYLVSRSSF